MRRAYVREQLKGGATTAVNFTIERSSVVAELRKEKEELAAGSAR